ncbi:Xenotropic and polytropic retrovirus receptor 1 [Sorochytrium milnesiophthora]
MKFAKTLVLHQTVEWSTQYIDYKKLKKGLKKVAKRHSLPSAPSLTFGRALLPRSSSSLSNAAVAAASTSVDERDDDIDQVQPMLSLRARLASRPDEDRDFFDLLDAELAKVNDFYSAKEDEALAAFEKLKAQVEVLSKESCLSAPGLDTKRWGTLASLMSDFGDKLATLYNNSRQPAANEFQSSAATFVNKNTVQFEQLERAVVLFYQSLELLRNYKVLNLTGFTKILKKHDKVARHALKALYFEECVHPLRWCASKQLDEMMAGCESLFVQHFNAGHRKSVTKLRTPQLDGHTYHTSTWRCGFLVGAGLCISAQALQELKRHQATNADVDHPLFPDILQTLGSLLIPIACLFLFTVNQYVWKVYKVNYRFLFELDHRHTLHYHQFLNVPSLMFFAWSVCLYCSAVYRTYDFIQYLPAIFAGCCLLCLLNPLPICYHKSRSWLRVTLGRILCAPAYKVQFADFFIADIIISNSYMLSYLPTLLCMAALDADSFREASQCSPSTSWIATALTILPYHIRLMQSLRRWHDTGDRWPHAANALKYGINCCVVSSSVAGKVTGAPAVHTLWVLLSCCATLYSYSWDIIMDWGFLQPNSQNPLLRNHLSYSPRALYYQALVTNLLFRITWILVISPGHWGDYAPLVSFGTALIEVLRRFQWIFLRAENEHTNNCGKYRAINEVPLVVDVSVSVGDSQDMA